VYFAKTQQKTTMFENTIEIEKKTEKNSMDTKRDIDSILDRQCTKATSLVINCLPVVVNVFSEIVRRYLSKSDNKVVVLTHRIELCKQT
jgi:hypothetical protein